MHNKETISAVLSAISKELGSHFPGIDIKQYGELEVVLSAHPQAGQPEQAVRMEELVITRMADTPHSHRFAARSAVYLTLDVHTNEIVMTVKDGIGEDPFRGARTDRKNIARVASFYRVVDQ